MWFRHSVCSMHLAKLVPDLWTLHVINCLHVHAFQNLWRCICPMIKTGNSIINTQTKDINAHMIDLRYTILYHSIKTLIYVFRKLIWTHWHTFLCNTFGRHFQFNRNILVVIWKHMLRDIQATTKFFLNVHDQHQFVNIHK